MLPVPRSRPLPCIATGLNPACLPRLPYMKSDRMDTNTVVQVLRFDVGTLRCAVPLANVREVQRAVAITALPGAPAVVKGVIDVRGEVLPVIDPAIRLGLPRRPLRSTDSFIFLWTGSRNVALRADAVHWIEELARGSVAGAEQLTRGGVAVAGVARMPEGLVLLHDAEGLLRQAEEEALEEALAANSNP